MSKHDSVLKLIIIAMALLLQACDSNLNTLDGPKAGKVSGLMCVNIETLLAAREHDIVRANLIRDGKCLEERNAREVKVVSTVSMPADGKYSKIVWPGDGKEYWVKTDSIR